MQVIHQLEDVATAQKPNLLIEPPMPVVLLDNQKSTSSTWANRLVFDLENIAVPDCIADDPSEAPQIVPLLWLVSHRSFPVGDP